MDPIDFETDCPWAIAERLGLRYNGDVNTFDHGGYYYNLHNWEECGYADVVAIQRGDGKIFVTTGCINKSDRDFEGGYKCCGYTRDGDNLEQSGDVVPITPEVMIECIEAYCGVESDGHGHTMCDDWSEGRFWRKISYLIEGLAE